MTKPGTGKLNKGVIEISIDQVPVYSWKMHILANILTV